MKKHVDAKSGLRSNVDAKSGLRSNVDAKSGRRNVGAQVGVKNKACLSLLKKKCR